jgi:sulfide dehydrogenase cytochrome subunit
MSRCIGLFGAAVLAVAPGFAPAAAPPGAASCLGCHNTVTAGDSPVPPLGTLSSEQMVAAMQAFRGGTRPSTVMERIAKGFSDEEIKAIADWYARSNQ